MALRKLLALAAAFLATMSSAQAAVTISFYAHQLGSKGIWVEFPHAYVTLAGTTQTGALPVKANFGFTPPVVGPSILFGKVDGTVVSAEDDYIAKDKPIFSLPLSDRQYAAVLAVVARWRNAAQPSYDLDTHNCVIFVKDIAAAVGLSVVDDDKFVRDPAAFLADLKSRNGEFLARSGAPSFRTSQVQAMTANNGAR
ncbi:MAG TPA: hypothetical protein VNU97_08520 [Rhizomicrobium sp.]|jgi:hypothetical protein|nr:hypothetical protein [Rhizomicrobium sp.]